jgi:hypothetical protein
MSTRRGRALMPAPKAGKDDQHKRFIETARELECDEDKERFETKLGKIARQKPPDHPSDGGAPKPRRARSRPGSV